MKVWESFLTSLEPSFGKITVDKWLRTLTIEKFDAGNLHIAARDSFQVSWIEEHILPLAKKSLKNNNGRSIKLHIRVGNVRNAPLEPAQVPEAPPKPETLNFTSDPLEKQCTFEQFIPGKDNIVPFRVMSRLSGWDEEKNKLGKDLSELNTFNPIYLYGPKGCGKSHLAMATAGALRKHGLSVFYISASNFAQHVVSAIRRSKMRDFRATYRHVDVLIVEDIDKLSNKSATQEEFFHTFNTLHTAGKQIILTSTLAPQYLEEIEQRLISRFEWGITLPLKRVQEASELEEILIRRSALFKFPMEQDLKSYIATSFPTARSASDAIESLVLQAQLKKMDLSTPITLRDAEKYLHSMVEQEQKEKLTPEKIVQMVADLFGIRIDDILTKSQSRESVFPRQLCMYLMREELKMPYMKIGKFFARDHSTVITSIKQIKKHLESKDSDASCYINDLQRQILNAG